MYDTHQALILTCYRHQYYQIAHYVNRCYAQMLTYYSYYHTLEILSDELSPVDRKRFQQHQAPHLTEKWVITEQIVLSSLSLYGIYRFFRLSVIIPFLCSCLGLVAFSSGLINYLSHTKGVYHHHACFILDDVNDYLFYHYYSKRCKN